MSEETQTTTKKRLKMPTPGPKTRKSSETFFGALSLIIGWIVGDIMGYEMPDYVLQSFTIVFMVVAARISEYTT